MFELRRIGIVKRASALLLDVILLLVLTTGFMFIISLICKFDRAQDLANEYFAEWDDFRAEYGEGVAKFYGFKYEDDGDTITDADGRVSDFNDVLDKLDASNGENAETAEAYAKLQDLKERVPAAMVNAQYRYVYSLLFMMVSIGTLLSYIILEFVLPIIFKNGQTVGKKVFGICVVRNDCVKISILSLFARTLLGKFAIETMFPVLLVFLFLFGGLGWLAIVLLAAITILNIALFFATKNRTPIHDMLAMTVVVDMKLQMIFASEEELIQKKTLAAKESVENTKS